VRLRLVATTFLIVLLAALLGATVGADFLWRSAIGLDPTAFPAGQSLQSLGDLLFPGLDVALAGLLLGLGTVLGVPIVAFFIVRGQRRTLLEQADPGRRNFLSGSLAGGGAALAALVAGGGAMVGRSFFGLGHKEGRGWKRPLTEIFGGQVQKTHPEWKDEWRGSRIQSYGRLGRTEWPVSDTVLGTGPIRGELGTKIVRLAMDRGVNYIDTAPDYSAEGSEKAVGEAIRGVPRDSFFLATKWCTPIGHLPAGTSVERYKEVVEDSLDRLGTDYVDLIHVHSCDELDRLLDPNVHEAFAQLKAEGKARFLGFSSHTPNLLEVANAAIDSGKFDVMMLAYHHGIWPGLSDVIERAQREQDMGVVAMKTLKGAKHHGLEGFQDEQDSYAQAALKWAHGNPNVSCAVISFFDLQHVDEYLYASGKTADADDVAILDKYDSLTADTYCVPHCGACLSSCPEKVAINDVLRHRMYFEDYRSERQAIDLYAALERNASVCAGCSAPCTGSCPYGIRIQERMVGAHELLDVRPTAS
jgi:predicted aldo/keto reductase-like oxidoreductase